MATSALLAGANAGAQTATPTMATLPSSMNVNNTTTTSGTTTPQNLPVTGAATGALAGVQAAKPVPVITAQPAIAQVNQAKATLTNAQTSLANQSAKKAAVAAPAGELKFQESLNKGAANPQQANLPAVTPVTPQPMTGISAADLMAGKIDANGNPIQQTTQTDESGKPRYLNEYELQMQKNQEQSDQAYQSFQNSISQLQNGTFPLNPTQQAQVDALKGQYQQLIEQQKIANKNYEGGIAVTNATSGRARYAPEIALGITMNAVNAGIQKIGNIETEMNSAVANMEDGFRTNNMKLVQSAYEAYQQHAQAKSDQITKVYTAVANAAKDARDYNYQLEKDKIDQENKKLAAQFESEKFSYQQKKDAKDQYLATQKLSEDQKKNLVDAWYKQEQIAIKKQADDPFSGALTGKSGSVPVQVSSTGVPNKLQQAEFLKNLPPDIQAEVKGLADYTMNPANISLRDNRRENLVNLAKQYDPTFDASNFNARAAFNKNWQSGELGRTRGAINTGINHLGELAETAAALQNKQFKGALGIFTKNYNTIENLIKENSGDPTVAAFNSTINKVATELAKIYKGNASPTEQEIAEERKALGLGSSPDQINAVVRTATQLIGGKLQSMGDQYTNTMGKPPSDILTKSAQNTIKNMIAKGINVDTETLDPGNSWKYQSLQNFYQQNPESQSAIKSIMQADPTLTDDQIMEVLHYGSSFNQVGGDTNTASLGSLSQKYESSGNPGAIGYDSTGGWSYGTYQLAHDNARRFVEQSPYAQEFAGIPFNSPEFRSRWKQIAQEDPQGFAQAQEQYIAKTHFEPLAAKAAQAGLDLSQRSPVLAEVIFSTGVQHGGNTDVVNRALAKVGADASDEDIIKAIYNERWGNGARFASSTPQVKNAVYNRFFGKNGELATALQQLNTNA